MFDIHVRRFISRYRFLYEPVFSCCSNKKTPPYHSNLSFVMLRNGRPTLAVRPQNVRRPRLALGDGAATRVGFFGN